MTDKREHDDAVSDGGRVSAERSSPLDPAADPAGDADASAREKLGTFGTALGAGAAGLVLMLVWGIFVSSIALPLAGGELTPVQETLVSTTALGLGMATGAAVYLRVSDRTTAFLDIRWPTLQDGGYVVVGLIGLFAAVYGISWVTQQLGVPPSQHSIVEAAQAGNPELLLALVPLSVLVIGPGEELLFRNVVQKILYDAFPRRAAIGLASVVFALVHIPAYSTGTPGQIATSIATVFALSLLLGWLYHRTESLVVPALVHGLYNAVLFGSLYVELTGGT